MRHVCAMGKRRLARERAVQFLFQCDLNPPEDIEAALREFWITQHPATIADEDGPARWGETRELPPLTGSEAALQVFATELIRGVIERRDELDERIRKYARNWDLKRMAIVDRNIMRLAIYEMLYRLDIPPVVSINEAVDIAKRYSTDDSGKFVNGILDQVRAELLRPARTVDGDL